MIYIIDGQEVTAQQAQATADQIGIPLQTYLDSVGATIKEGSEKDFINGVAEEDAAAAPIYPEASELELQLENISSELQSLPSRSTRYRPLLNKQIRTTKELENFYDAQEMNIDVPETIINKTEDQVKPFLEKNFRWLKVEETGIRNAVKAYLPDGVITIDLKPFSPAGRQKELENLKKIYEADKSLTARDKLGMTATRAVNSIAESRNPDIANQILAGTGYEIVQIKDEEIPLPASFGGIAGISNLQTPSYKYSLLKDGEAVLDQTTIKDVDDYLEKNLSKEDFSLINTNTYEATHIALEERRKALEKEAKVIQNDQSIDKKYFEDRFVEDIITSLGLEKDSEEALQFKQYFRSRKASRLLGERQAARRRKKLSPQEEYLESLKNLSDLPDNLKELITINFGSGEEGKNNFSKAITDGLKKFRHEELMNRATTIGERLMEESGNQELLRLSQLYEIERKDQFENDMKNRVGLITEIYQNQNNVLVDRGKQIAENAPKDTKFSLTLVDGSPVFQLTNDRNLSTEEGKIFEEAKNQMFRLQDDFANLQFDFNSTIENITKDIEEFYAGSGVNEQIYSDAIKEYGLPQLVAKDVNDAFASVLLTIPTLLDSEWALNEQRILNDKNKYYETMTTWDGGDFTTYFFRTLGQQSANIALAIGTGAAGGMLGKALGYGSKFTNAMTANAIGLEFGLSSGTQTFRDLTIQQDLVKLAKSQGVRAKKALDSGAINQEQFDRVMEDINNTITLNELEPDQIIKASIANGVIEGFWTRVLGTAPNTIKLLKDFKTPSNITTIANNIGASSSSKIANMAGKPLATRLVGEIAEEELIYLGQSYITEFGILDRELNLDQFDDTFFATVITLGASQAPGVGYSALVNYGATNKVEKQLNSLKINNQNLSKLIANETNPEIKKSLLFSMANNFDQMGLDVDRLAVNVLNLGSKDINRLIGTELIKQDLKAKAGVMPGSSKVDEAEIINAYKQKVGKEQADIFDDQLDALNTITKKIKDKIDSPGNLKTAQDALGDIYTTYNSKLKESNDDGYNNKTPQDKLVQIINTVRTDLAAENLENAKANPEIVKFVENQLTDSGTPLDNVKKEMLYMHLGKQLALDKSRGIANQINVNTAAETILKDVKNVKVVQINSQEQLEKAMDENKVAASKRPTFDKMPFGFVVGNTIYTQNKTAIDEDLEQGYLRAGTVVLHEMAHIIDDGRMNDKGRATYANNLFKAISTSDNAALRIQHNNVIQQLNTIYGNQNWNDADATYKDEYTKYMQETAFMYEDEIQLEKDENALVRTFNDLVTDANNLNTPDKALNYMLANNSAFRKGKLSRKSRRALEKAKASDLKLSEKNLNILADKFKDNPDALTAEQMVDFYQQYTNTALAAMGYNIGKGDIAPDFALGVATNSFDRVVRTYKPEDGSFTNWIYSTVGREGKAKIGEEIERKKSLVRQSQAQEQTRLKSDETAESRIELEERAARESKTQQRKIDPRKLPLVSRKIKDIEKDVDIRPEKVPTATFKSISDDYGRKVASRIYDVSENKLGKDAKNLTYADNIRDGRLVKSELGQLQQDFKTVDGTKRAIKLLPEFNIVTPEATVDESGETIPTSRNLSGTSLGIANKVLDFFYENYTDPRALSENAETRKQAITNKSGRSKGSTSQTQVKRLKPEFRGTISNEAVKKAQNEFAEINRDFAEIKDARARLKAIRDVGQKLKGWTNLIGGIVANTVADQKVSKMPLRTAKPRKQIRADIRGGRSPIQFSQKVRAAFDLELGGRSKVDRLMSVYSLDPTLNLKQDITTLEGRKKIVDAYKKVVSLGPKAMWIGPRGGNVFTTSGKDYGVSMSEFKKDGSKNPKYSKQKADALRDLRSDINKMLDDPNTKFGAPIPGVTDFSLSSYNTVFQGTESEIKEKADAFNNKSTKIHKALWERISRVKKDDIPAIATYLKLVANHTGHWHKLGAAIYGYSVNPKQRYEYEHAMPATSAYLYLLNSILGKENFTQSYDLVMENYKLIALDKAEDNKLRKAGLQRAMPFGWDITNNFWWQRYFNTLVAKQNGGINPASIVDLDGNTLQDVFTINNDGSPYAGQTFIPQANAEITKGDIADDAMTKARNSVKYSEKTKKARVFDFDDTLAQTKSKVIVTMPAEEGMLDIAARRLFGETALKNKPGFLKTFDSLNKEQQAEVLRDVPGAVRKIDATEFAKEAANLEAEGAKFNFTEFDKIIEGKKGPLFDVAKKIQDAKNSGESIFILTARPPTAAVAIKKFLSELGLDIPLANITGLADGKPQAKADWFVDKYNEGFNDFYFADDALKNVNAVKKIFDVLDVKSRVQQARIKFSEKLSTDFNAMIERNKGIKTEATFSQIQARRRGKNQKRFAFFVPPSADDFRGLTMYTFAGKGKQGELDQEFFDKALIRPYQRGVASMEVARTAARNDYRALLNDNKDIRKKLKKKVEDTRFTHDEAIRVYLWNQEGFEIPGLSKADEKKLTDFVKKDKALVEFANGVKIVTRKKQYLQPTEFWDGSTILGDLNNIVRSVNREQFLAEFIENVDTIFSEQNLNKVEAIYGFRVRESLENAIFRMKTGQNKNKGSGRLVNEWNNWVNNSVGAIMFFNRRSALLQTISTVNFVNWSDNNPIKAGIAFANQPQYWKDFITLWNSPKLVSRRRGLQSDIQEAEIAAAAKKGGAQGVISYLLKVGFTPTQLADSFAIASGGATFYRNRLNSYKKQGLNDADAQKKAFEDFSSIADETQQSADPMLISQQQASVLGRLVLAFQNTPMQYTRLIKKAGQDLINNRGSKTENISKIIYYGFVQNLIFSTLQNALFALLPGFDDEEEDFKTDKERDKFFEKEQRREDTKIARTINSMSDTLLRGSGLAGAVVSTFKNVILEYMEQKEKSEFNRENADILIAAINISPPIGSKVRKVNNFLQTEKFEKDVIAERGFDVTIDGKFQLSPTYDLVGELSSAIFNLPLDRAVDEVNAITEALDTRNTSYQRLALAAGWRQWDVNARTEEHDLLKTTAKERRKKEGIEKAKETRKRNAEIKKKVDAYRARILNTLPDSVRIEIQKREKKLNEETPLFKLKQLNEEYNLNINYE